MGLVIGGIYEHYKGKRYKVVCVAKHSETLSLFVVYQALYGNNEFWIRPYEMFTEKIDLNGEKVDRFKFIGNELNSLYEVFVEFPDTIKQRLFENNVNIEYELSQELDGAIVKHSHNNDDTHKKGIELIILATGASISAVLLSISKLLRVIGERPREVQKTEFNDQGDIIREQTILLEPSKVSQKTEIDLELGTTAIKFKVLDEIK